MSYRIAESFTGKNFRKFRGFGPIRESFNLHKFSLSTAVSLSMGVSLSFCECFNRENLTFSTSRKFSPAKIPTIR